MTEFDEIIDQQRPVGLLKTLIVKESVPHALLFTGMEGVGKLSAAKSFAKAINCRNIDNIARNDINGQGFEIPCNQCRSCRKIASGSHPDIHLVEPAGVNIKIEQIRSLCAGLSLKPLMAQTRVAIVANAHALNPEAANAFLKVLEEPPERTVILLTAFQLSDLLPTIVSRCQHIRFNPISRKRVKEYLIEHCQADPEIAGLAASLSNGSLKKGISIIDGQWLDSRNWLLDEIQRLFHRPIPVSLALGEKLSKNRETAQDFMEIMDTWLRDIIVCRFAGDNTINKDRLEILLEISNKIEVPAVLELIDALHTAKKHIRGNSNVRLTLEVFFLRLAKELTRVT